MSCAILIPTTGRRAAMLEQVVAAFREQGFQDIRTISGYSWGEGLNRLVTPYADYFLTICDDTVPQPGWFEAARATLDKGLTPATRYLDPDGSPLRIGSDDVPDGKRVDWCRSFLLTPALYEQVGPFIDASWYVDIDYSERLRAAGREIVSCPGFAFTHLNGERDWITPEEDERQREQYELSQRRRGVHVTD